MHRDADHLATALEKVVNVLETTGTEHRRVIPAGRKLLEGERQIDCLDRRKVEIARGGNLARRRRHVTSLVSEELNETRCG